MAPPPPTRVWASALALAAFQVVGTFGASDNQPERKAVDSVAILPTRPSTRARLAVFRAQR